FPILNVAVGSFSNSYTGLDSPSKVTAGFPARMQVDWIRLYANPHTRVFLGKNAKEKGRLGIYTELPLRKLAFGDASSAEFEFQNKAVLSPWNNLKVSQESGSAAEGKHSWLLEAAAGEWFGGSVWVANHRNMSNYSDGFLHFTAKSKSPAALRVGIKSSRGGESWLPLGDENSEFGFLRDGQWHPVKVPLNRFSNIDFETVHQLFMIAGEAPGQPVRLSIDHVWWQPSGQRPRPVGSSFGVFTDQPAHRLAGAFKLGRDGNFFIWEKTLTQTRLKPFEGQHSIGLKSSGGPWCGAAFTPNVKYDLSRFSRPSARLHFAIKTRSKKTFKIGMKSGNVKSVGQKWVTFKPGADPFGFKRNGEWQVVEIPMSEFANEVDLSQVSQLFEVLADDGAVEEVGLDDICFLDGKP
ncbi:MAG: hypothetical protein VX438_04525, partial [Planctomycetota bacterium]|nr:hypothetical protein [Planctomycetota bacterium]